MVETEGALPGDRQRVPMGSGGAEEPSRPDDVRLDERLRPVDRAVDMALGGEVDDDVRIEDLESTFERETVADVSLNEAVPLVTRDGIERAQVAGVGQLVEVQHAMIARLDQVSDERRADEPSPARHQHARAHRRPQASLDGSGSPS